MGGGERDYWVDGSELSGDVRGGGAALSPTVVSAHFFLELLAEIRLPASVTFIAHAGNGSAEKT